MSYVEGNHTKENTHTARLICIEPIKKDTAEDLLRKIIERWDNQDGVLNITDIIERAKRITK